MTDRSRFETALRRHLSACREKSPIPPRESLSPLEEAQYRILGGHLVSWLSNWGPELLQERAVLSKLEKWDPNPVVCFHSVMPGLVAAREVIPDGTEGIVYGLPTDFESMPVKDNKFRLHVELHSLFSRAFVSKLGRKVRNKCPLSKGEAYFLHHDESVLGPLFARGARHLWKWNGKELILLEEAFETWVS